MKSNADAWAMRWLDSVVSGENTMSQRKLTSIEVRGGGLATVQELAKERGVHLLRFIDDKGNELIAASKHPFQVIC